MHRFALIFALCSASTASAGVVYDVVPSSSTTNINGLVFSPLGGPLIVTNTLSRKEGDTVTDYYLNFGLAYLRTDASGNVFFGASPLYQLYVLDGPLPPPVAPGIQAEGLFVGESEAVSLGAGRYDYRADLVGRLGMAGPFDLIGSLDLLFDTTLPLGRQVEGGYVTFSAVPEPASMALALIGGGIALMVYGLGQFGFAARIRWQEEGQD